MYVGQTVRMAIKMTMPLWIRMAIMKMRTMKTLKRRMTRISSIMRMRRSMRMA